jgi:acyl-CoA thioesterase I
MRIGALILCIAVAACGDSAKLSRLPPDAVVLAFGDSLTYGTGADEAFSYPHQLESLIGRKVVKAGIPGEVSAAGLERLPAVLDEHQPRLLILTHGGNDFLRKLDRAQAAANLRAMVKLAKDRGIDVVLLAVPEPGLIISAPAFYEEVAVEFRVPFEAGILPTVLGDRALKADLVHPNAEGYRRIAQAVAALLKKAGAV